MTDVMLRGTALLDNELILHPTSKRKSAQMAVARLREQSNDSVPSVTITPSNNSTTVTVDLRRARSMANKRTSSGNVQRDKDNNVVFPLKFGQLIIHSLGKIVTDRPGFHTTGQVFPAGFKASREYPSMVNPEQRVRYIAEILDEGGEAPVFQISPSEGHGEMQRSTSASGAAKAVLSAVNLARGRTNAHNTISGPNFFGLTHPVVASLILEMEGIDRLTDFIPGLPSGRGRKSKHKRKTPTPTATPNLQSVREHVPKRARLGFFGEQDESVSSVTDESDEHHFDDRDFLPDAAAAEAVRALSAFATSSSRHTPLFVERRSSSSSTSSLVTDATIAKLQQTLKDMKSRHQRNQTANTKRIAALQSQLAQSNARIDQLEQLVHSLTTVSKQPQS